MSLNMTTTSDNFIKGDTGMSQEYGCIIEQNDKDKRSSWVPSVNVTPLKKLVKSRHPSSQTFQAKCKLLREMCSPEKLKNLRTEQLEEEDGQPPLLTPRSRKEDIEHVYEKFEILLNVLRVERQKEKLEAEYEIQSLKTKIALLEEGGNEENNNPTRNGDSRPSLGALENVLPTTPGSPQQKQSARAYEQELLKSVQQLMALENQFVPEKDRKLLACYFEEGAHSNTTNTDGKPTNTSETMKLRQKVLGEHGQDLLDQIPLQYLTLIQQQKKQLLHEEEQNRVLTSMLEQVQQELKQTREEMGVIEGVHRDRVTQDDGKHITTENTNNTGSRQSVGRNLASTEGKSLEEKMNRQMQELQEKVHKVQGELTGSKRNHSDVLMKLAVESTCKASLSMKLDAALAQIEKQKETISRLNQELGRAKYECDLYSQKAEEVMKESQELLLDETRVSLNDFSF